MTIAALVIALGALGYAVASTGSLSSHIHSLGARFSAHLLPKDDK